MRMVTSQSRWTTRPPQILAHKNHRPHGRRPGPAYKVWQVPGPYGILTLDFERRQSLWLVASNHQCRQDQRRGFQMIEQLGLTLTESKELLGDLQQHLVQGLESAVSDGYPCPCPNKFTSI